MKDCIQTFNLGLNELQTFLVSTEHETELLRLLNSFNTLGSKEIQLLETISLAHINRKRYIYSVAIVSLYGLLERLVHTLIEAYVYRIAGLVDSYDSMPEAIKKNHVPLSMDLLKAIGSERWMSSTEQDVIANLHTCLSNVTPFRINGAAFILHRGNLTLSKITDFLSTIGVGSHLRRVSLTSDLLEFFQKTVPERDIRKVADQDLQALFRPIDDLVERRNQISHGVIDIDNIESTELLKERCQFVAAYGRGLLSILIQELLKCRIRLPDVQSSENLFSFTIVQLFALSRMIVEFSSEILSRQLQAIRWNLFAIV